MTLDISLGADTQQTDAASRRMLRSAHLQRWRNDASRQTFSKS